MGVKSVAYEELGGLRRWSVSCLLIEKRREKMVKPRTPGLIYTLEVLPALNSSVRLTTPR